MHAPHWAEWDTFRRALPTLHLASARGMHLTLNDSHHGQD